MKITNIVTIGGGSGAPVVIKALIQAGFSNIKAICTAMDTGGRSGLVRTDERDRVISVGDLLRNLMALVPESNHLTNIQAFRQMIDFTDGRRRNLGYSIYYALLEKFQNNFIQVQDLLEQLLNIKFSGIAIPITLEPTQIHIQTQSGQQYIGEHQLDYFSMSKDMVTKIWIDPPVTSTPEAISAIKQADYIIYCPGSLYGSIIANFLPQGVAQALVQSSATKIFITNLVSNRNEDHHFKPIDYWQLFKKYTHLDHPFEIIIVPNITQAQFQLQHLQVAKSYAHEHSFFLGWDTEQLKLIQQKGVKTISSHIFFLSPEYQRLRHDPHALANIFKQIIKNQSNRD